MTRKLIPLAVITALILSPLPARAQMAVFDAAALAENLVAAAHAVEQIDNQILSLQNEAMMLDSMARNLQRLDVSSLDAILGDLQAIDGLMNQAQGIAFQIGATQDALARDYPRQYDQAVTSDQLVADSRRRWSNSMDGLQQTLLVQSQVAGTLATDSGTLSQLVGASQGAEGGLQAQQATNQLLALSTKQQMQIQTLMAAQYRAQALEQTRAAESQEQARAALASFLGGGDAYPR